MSKNQEPTQALGLHLLHRMVIRRQRRALKLLLWLPLLPQRLLEAQDAQGWRPLHWAVALGEREMAERLLLRGAAVNPADNEGRTPMHHAVQFGQEGLLDLLRDRGAHETADAAGVTPGELSRRLLARGVVGAL